MPKKKKRTAEEVRKGLSKSEFGALGADLRKTRAVDVNLGKQMNAKELLTTRAGAAEFKRRDKEAGKALVSTLRNVGTNKKKSTLKEILGKYKSSEGRRGIKLSK